ncbi:MAG: flagellar biosynthetic protein FlhB [Paracoccaceae bacterium]|jgi:flagellar biosynthetic protein FlhB
MSEEGDEDKQHEPSQKKLDDARKKGEVPKSTDLITAAGYGGFLLAAMAFGSASLLGLGGGLAALLDHADTFSKDVFAGSGAPMMGGLMISMIGQLAPWFGVPAALAILAVLAQRAFVIAPTKLQPKLSRISPISGFKNKFGRSGFFEFSKSFAKLSLYCVILGVYLTYQMPRILGAMYLSAGLVTTELLRLVVGLLFIVLIVATALGVVDFVWQQAEHTRKHRMSRKELMDEMKGAEGDPAMKQQRRQKGFEIAMSQMLTDVPGADVIIVNPTHYAVALKWDRAGGGAPVCVAKGVDDIAARIREIANENAVPIHSDPPTARALHADLEIGDEIRSDHYRAVAAAIRFAELIRKKAGGR